MRRATLAILGASLLALPVPLVGPAGADDPLGLQDDARSGQDAGDAPEGAIHLVPGEHDGTLADAHDRADWYAFHADAGQGILLRVGPRPGEAGGLVGSFQSGLRGGFQGRLYAPGGAEVSYNPPLGEVLANETGAWRLRVSLPACLPNPQPCAASLLTPDRHYRITLDVVDLPPQDDAGTLADAGDTRADATPLTEGRHEGWAGPWDRSDVYAFTLQAGEALDVHVFGAATGAQLVNASGRRIGRAGHMALSSGEDAMGALHVAAADEVVYLEVAGTGDGAPYVLSALRAPPSLHVEAQQVASIAGSLAVRAGEIAVGTSDGIWLVRNGILTPLVTEAWAEALAYDGQDDLHFWNLTRPGLDVVGSSAPSRPFAQAAGHLAYGAEGHLYALLDTAFGGPCGCEVRTRLQRIGPDGSVALVVDTPGSLRFLAASPGGSLYAIASGRDVHRVTPGSNETTVVAEGLCCVRGLAFDAAGRAYTTSLLSGALHRVDLSTGVRILVGHGIAAYSLAFGEDRLVASGWMGPTGDVPATAELPLGVAGFPGFRPTFGPDET